MRMFVLPQATQAARRNIYPSRPPSSIFRLPSSARQLSPDASGCARTKP